MTDGHESAQAYGFGRDIACSTASETTANPPVAGAAMSPIHPESSLSEGIPQDTQANRLEAVSRTRRFIRRHLPALTVWAILMASVLALGVFAYVFRDLLVAFLVQWLIDYFFNM